MIKKTVSIFLLLAIFLVANTAFAVDGPKVLTVIDGPTDIFSIDPSLLEDSSARQAAITIFGGLTSINEETSEIEPNLAESWTVSDDGTIYTFKIQEGIPWVKYDVVSGEVIKTDRFVTANDIRNGIIRTLKPETASAYAYLDAWNIAGAEEFNNGTSDESVVAINVIDDYTLEVTFKQAAAFNLSIIGMSMNYAQPQWAIESYGDKWTDVGNIETFGPFTLKEWIHDDRITFVKNPFYPGTKGVPKAKIDELVMLFRDQASAMSEYEAGNVDWVEVTSADIDRVKADPVLSKEFTTSERACTEYYLINTMAEFTDDVRIRKALSYSVNRQDIVDYVTRTGEQPARTMIHPSLAGAPILNDVTGPNFDPDFAREQLNLYLEEKGLQASDISITIAYNSNAKSQLVSEAIQQMWKDELGINVSVEGIESKVYWALVDSPDMAQVSRLGWCPVYFDADYFIKSAFKSGGMNNEVDEEGNPSGGVRWKNIDFDSLVDAAAAELDNDKRIEMYTNAEKIIGQEDVVFIPVYYFSFASLTKPHIERTFSVGGVQTYEKWDIVK